MASTPRLFYSYSSKDQRYRDALETFLVVFRRNRLLQGWDFRKLIAGDDFDERIRSELERADVIVLLVSQNFLSSEYIWSVELKRALQRHRAGSAHVIPILLSDSLWQDTPLKKLEVLPTGKKPIKSWRDQAKAWTDVAKGIRNVLERVGKSKPKAEAKAPAKVRTPKRPAAAAPDWMDRAIGLAAEYERVRKSMKPGDVRTEAMEKVFNRMMALAEEIVSDAKLGAQVLPRLTRSTSPGERLVAIALLHRAPAKTMVRWLGQRLSVETPFVGYHAALALGAAARMLSRDCRPSIQRAIDQGFAALGTAGAWTDRASALLDAQHILEGHAAR